MLDCIVIGAGAAGIGAGLALLRQRTDFVVLEAKDRVGGRAYTDTTSIGHSWDQGCHWFHSASRNPLRQVALTLGHRFRDTPWPYSTRLWMDGAMRDTGPIDEAYEAVAARTNRLLAKRPDVALSEALEAESALTPLIRHEYALNTSHEMEEISAADLWAFEDTHENTPVSGGYGTLIARLAGPLPVHLNTPALTVAITPKHCTVTTRDGALEAKAVILAVPQRVLDGGAIRITPRLPDHVTEAVASLPMGWFEKTAFAFDRDLFGPEAGNGVEILAQINGKPFPVAAGIFEDAVPFVVCHTAGHLARDLPQAERMAFCEEALVQAFGSSLRARITRRASTAWAADPFIGGAYSCARPGAAGARQALHEAIHERLFLAGEHTSLSAMATAHGAYVSGREAAHKALQLVGRNADVDPLWLPDGI